MTNLCGGNRKTFRFGAGCKRLCCAAQNGALGYMERIRLSDAPQVRSLLLIPFSVQK
jgi:hypothetical protein